MHIQLFKTKNLLKDDKLKQDLTKKVIEHLQRLMYFHHKSFRILQKLLYRITPLDPRPKEVLIGSIKSQSFQWILGQNQEWSQSVDPHKHLQRQQQPSVTKSLSLYFDIKEACIITPQYLCDKTSTHSKNMSKLSVDIFRFHANYFIKTSKCSLGIGFH